MLKRTLLIITIFGICLLTACSHTTKIPVGVLATEKFSVVEYLQDNAIFQAESKLVISGKAQNGVIMVATILDSKSNKVVEAYSDTNESGIWEIEVSTPETSMKQYQIIISDSNDVFTEKYENIRFGEVWFVLGDNIKTHLPSAEDISIEVSSDDKMFYYGNKWVSATPDISKFSYELLQKIESQFKIWDEKPLAIIIGCDDSTKIYQWLSKKVIDSRQIIKDYLFENSLYVEDDKNLTSNDMSYYYENVIAKNTGMSVNQVIWYQGLSDIEMLSSSEKFLNNPYFLMLYTAISEIEANLNINGDFYIIQESSVDEEKVEILRKIQSNISNYFSKCEIIPTYDLNYVEEGKILEVDLDKLLERIEAFIYDNYNAPKLNNVVKIYNEEKEVVQINLMFENLEEFDEVVQVEGLKFFGMNNEEIDLEYEVYERQISIYLEQVNKDTNLTEIVSLLRIEYAYDGIINNANLKAQGIAMIPFEVLIINN